MRTHLRFKNFHPGVKAAAEALFDAKPWRQSTQTQAALASDFVNAASRAYRIPSATIVVVEDIPMLNGQVEYVPAAIETDSLGEAQAVHPATMRFYGRISIATLFMVFRQHVLSNGVAPVSHDDPKAWGCSLFFSVKPAMYRARVREGRIEGVPASETFKDETWNRLVVAGYADQERGVLLVERNELDTILAAGIPENAVSDQAEAFLQEQASAADAEAADAVADVQEYGNVNVDEMNRDALRRLAAHLNIAGRGSMTAPELREACRGALAQ